MTAKNPYGPRHPRRILGHALKEALARSWRAAAGLGSHLLTHPAADRDMAELRRGLAEADCIADALLERGSSISAPPALDITSLLLRMEPSLRLVLAPSVTLTIRDSEPRHLVSADTGMLEMLIRRLVESAARGTADGGELTVSAGWLDCVSGDWPSNRVPPRRYVRLTIATSTPERPGDAWWRVIEPPSSPTGSSEGSAAAMIERLNGCLMIESAERQPSRVHICVPAVFDDSES